MNPKNNSPILCPNKTLGCDGTGWDYRCTACGEHVCITWAALWNPVDGSVTHLGCAARWFDPADEARRARKDLLEGDPAWEQEEEETDGNERTREPREDRNDPDRRYSVRPRPAQRRRGAS